MKIHSHNGTPILLDDEERSTTTAMNEAAKYNYLDMLLLPEYHDRKWGIYCIAIDNPTYLQVTLGYINMHMHIYMYIRIYSHVYIYVSTCTVHCLNVEVSVIKPNIGMAATLPLTV